MTQRPYYTFHTRHLLRLLLVLLSPLLMTVGYTPTQAATGDWPTYLYNSQRTSGNLDRPSRCRV